MSLVKTLTATHAKRFFCSLLATIFFLFIYPLNSSAGTKDGLKAYTLEELLKIAFEKNPSLAVFKANIGASRGEIIASKAWINPEIEFEGGKGRARYESDSGEEYSISLGQTFEWPGKRSSRQKFAGSLFEEAEHNIDVLKLEIAFEVKQAFYQFLLNKKEIQISADNLKIAEELLKTAEVRVKSGEAPEFEQVKAVVEKLKASKELKVAENKIAISRARLNSLLANTLPDEFDAEGDLPLSGKKYNLDEILPAVIAVHPSILSAKKKVEAESYKLAMEKASVVPDVTLKGFFGRELDKDTYAMGVSIPLPLWYRRKGEITTALAEKEKSEAELFKTGNELSLALQQAYRNYEITREQISVFEQGLLKQAEEALRIAEFSYREGELGILEYLDAQRSYKQTQLEYIQARFEIAVSLAEIERLTEKL